MSYYKLPLVFEPQPEGGFTVTSPALPGLVTEGRTIAEALANVPDALDALRDAYDQLGQPFPVALIEPRAGSPIEFETLVGTP